MSIPRLVLRWADHVVLVGDRHRRLEQGDGPVVGLGAGPRFEGGSGRRQLTDGGRVLTVTALGDDLRAARDRAYGAVDGICWDGITLRRDIGWRALDRYSE
mgnify:CR=1 FL=1